MDGAGGCCCCGVDAAGSCFDSEAGCCGAGAGASVAKKGSGSFSSPSVAAKRAVLDDGKTDGLITKEEPIVRKVASATNSEARRKLVIVATAWNMTIRWISKQANNAVM